MYGLRSPGLTEKILATMLDKNALQVTQGESACAQAGQFCKRVCYISEVIALHPSAADLDPLVYARCSDRACARHNGLMYF